MCQQSFVLFCFCILEKEKGKTPQPKKIMHIMTREKYDYNNLGGQISLLVGAIPIGGAPENIIGTSTLRVSSSNESIVGDTLRPSTKDKIHLRANKRNGIRCGIVDRLIGGGKLNRIHGKRGKREREEKGNLL